VGVLTVEAIARQDPVQIFQRKNLDDVISQLTRGKAQYRHGMMSGHYIEISRKSESPGLYMRNEFEGWDETSLTWSSQHLENKITFDVDWRILCL
jgi:hypothetical protein